MNRTGRRRRWAAQTLTTLLAASGLSERWRRRRHRRGDFRLFVLEYHDVTGTGQEKEGVVGAERLRRHIRFLRHSYEFASLARARAELEDGGLGRDLVALTFDDGYKGNYTAAWPVLEEEGISATIFLATGFLDGEELWFDVVDRSLQRLRALEKRSRYAIAADVRYLLDADPMSHPAAVMNRLKQVPVAERDRAIDVLRRTGPYPETARQPLSWDQARTLARAGIELGAHTVSHPILSQLDRQEQEREIIGSRDRLTAELGSAPLTFAYPNGSSKDFTATTVALVAAAGFEQACTTIRGSNRPGADPYTLRRIGVGADSLAMLSARLAGLFDDEVRRRLPVNDR